MENNTNLNRIGCIGCLGYIILYATASWIIATIEWRPMWAWGLLIVYTLLWAGAMFWQYNKGKKDTNPKGENS